jgi:subfamily B ATP-binding cassette protein MsbA
MLSVWPMAILVDSVLAAQAKTDWAHRLFLGPLPASRLGQIVGLAVAGLLLKLGQEILSMAQSVVSNHINYNGLSRVRGDLFRKLQSLGISYHREAPQGDAIYRLSSDAFGCQAVLNTAVSAAVATLTLTVIASLLMTRNVRLTLLALSIAPPLAVLNILFGRRLKARSLDCREQDARFTSVVQRSIACVALVQAFGRESDEFGRFQDCSHGTIRAWWRLNRQQMAYNLLVGTVFGVGGAAVFGYGGYLVYRDRFITGAANALSLGDLVVFTSYLGMLWQPLCTLTGFAANAQGGAAGAQRVFEVLDRPETISDSPAAQSIEPRPRTLELNNVGFRYSSDAPVLCDLNLRITPGQMVAFVGPSGVGKSTLLNLLPRFYDPSCGSVCLDGIDLRQVRLADARRHVALVLQENLMLAATIAENIAYGRPRATDAQVREAATLAGAAAFIEGLPGRYDTLLSEGGANLSGGQRQRLAIARALLTEAPMLVLDEPTSAQDPGHEQQIVHTLRRLKDLRTIVLVSHRLSTVIDCDQIFVMEAGKIAERGTHAQLMSLRGRYWAMANAQLNGGPPDSVGPRLAA